MSDSTLLIIKIQCNKTNENTCIYSVVITVKGEEIS